MQNQSSLVHLKIFLPSKQSVTKIPCNMISIGQEIILTIYLTVIPCPLLN